jgi:nucleoside-diphosphate-sugar epimerase
MGGKGKSKGKGKSSNARKGAGKGKGEAKGTGKGKWTKVKPTVLVTGASGYVAGNVIQKLLDQKYKVRGTVRSLESDVSKLLQKEFPTVELFAADLLGGSEAFEKAMEGCTYVQHTASPFWLTCNDPQKDFVDPALKGTTSVMEAAVKAGIKRVVVTSSLAAVGPPQAWVTDPSKADKEKVFTEDDWNTDSTLEAGPYRLSKTLAEKKAMEIAEKADGLSLVVVNPSFVIGPMQTSRADGTSVQLIKAMLDGSLKEKGCNGGVGMGVVDVRDVAAAHVAAMESDSASGKRFLCTSVIGYGHLELADMIRDRFKAYPIPTEGKEILYKPKYSHERAKKELKIKFRPVEVSMRDMANAAIKLGLVEKKFYTKPAKFGIVSDLKPDSKGLNVKVKVVSTKGEKFTLGKQEAEEFVVGDSTGVVTLTLVGDEVGTVKVGESYEIHNSHVKMPKGFIRLQVGKWGKITKLEGGDEITPKTDKDVSATEYELVKD